MTSILSAIDPRYSVTGSNYPLSAKQKDLLALAESVGPNFALRAARYDREASFPFENYDDLRQAGLLGLCVPERFGGKGADLRSYAIVSATLGKYCGATALTFNMHACSTLWPGILADHLVDLSVAAAPVRSAFFPQLIRNDTVGGRLVALPWFVELIRRERRFWLRRRPALLPP